MFLECFLTGQFVALCLGAGAGKVHYAQCAVLGDQHGLRPDAQGREPALHHEDGRVELGPLH
jgi:hypothetical protein